MTKAETIFKNILKEAQYITRTWGVEESKAKNFACKFDTNGAGDGFVYQRTVNAVEKELDKYIKQVKLHYRFGVIDDEKLMREVEHVRLIRTGIAAGQQFVDGLKAI